MFTILPQQLIEELLPNTLLGNTALVLLAMVCMAIVIRGADWLVEGAAGLAYRMGMSKMVIGATILSIGTTSPEAAVSVLAAWSGNAGLALGNGVGSIIVDTGLIFAIGCLCVRLPADGFVLKRQGMIKIGVAVALAGISYLMFFRAGEAAHLGRWVGVLLVSGLIIYLAASIHWTRKHTRESHRNSAGQGDPQSGQGGRIPEVADDSHIPEQRSVPMLLVLGVVGLALVVVSGDALVQTVSVGTARWGVPEVVVAATLVAFGTSLPELMVAITSIRKGHAELMVGNVIGADILNVLFVIGAAALASPLALVEPGTPAPYIFLQLHLPVMLAMLLLFLVGILHAIRTGSFSRWLGLPLLLLYVGYIIAQFVLTTP